MELSVCDAFEPDAAGRRALFGTVDGAAQATYQFAAGCAPVVDADRASRSAHALACCAAFPLSPQLVVDAETSPEAAENRNLRPLWEVMKLLGDGPADAINPSTENNESVAVEGESLAATLYRTADGRALLVVANLGGKEATAKVTLDAAALKIAADADGKTFTPAADGSLATGKALLKGGVLEAPIAGNSFAAFEFKRNP
jgi:hypothetical protein